MPLSAACVSICPDATAELLATMPTTCPPRRPERGDEIPRAVGLQLEVLAVIADQLHEQRDVERRVHARGRMERAAEEGRPSVVKRSTGSDVGANGAVTELLSGR